MATTIRSKSAAPRWMMSTWPFVKGIEGAGIDGDTFGPVGCHGVSRSPVRDDGLHGAMHGVCSVNRGTVEPERAVARAHRSQRFERGRGRRIPIPRVLDDQEAPRAEMDGRRGQQGADVRCVVRRGRAVPGRTPRGQGGEGRPAARPRLTVQRSARPQTAALRRISAAARGSRSMKTTWAAPRLSASRPTAPVPAQPSSTRAPSTAGPRMPKRVSRRRSEVGRRPSQRGVNSRRPLRVPAMIRMFAPRLRRLHGDGSPRQALRGLNRGPLPYTGQPEALRQPASSRANRSAAMPPRSARSASSRATSMMS